MLGYLLNLKNPQTFNEKIQWLKLNDRTPLHTICADKFAVRKHIAQIVGEEYLIPLVLQTKNVSDIKPEALPDYPVIIKTNHDSSGGTFVGDKSILDWDAIRTGLRERLGVKYSAFGNGEWQYKNIPPCIIVEKLLLDSDGNIPFDYKMHFFNQKLVFTQVDLDRQENHTRNLYDPQWNLMPCTWLYKNGRQLPKPLNYDKMKDIAEILAKDFIYVRVDFYTLKDKIYIGELTFHPESGNGKFHPQEWDLKLGDQLKLPILEG